MLNVLVVDDEALVRTGIRYRIPWNDYQMQVVAEAGSVQEAIHAIHGTERIDIVFTDIVMPVQNGLELLRWLRDHHPFITTVVLSYHNEFNYIQEALRLGTTDYIIKTELDYPESIQSLRNISEKAMRNQQNRQNLKLTPGTQSYAYALAIAGLSDEEITVRQEDYANAKVHYPVSQKSCLLLYDRPLEEDILLKMEEYYGKNHIILTFDQVDTNTADLILAVSLFLSRDFFYECLPHLSVYAIDASSVLKHCEALTGPEYVRIEQELSSMQWVWNPEQLDRILESIRSSRLIPSSVYNLFYCVQTQWKQFFPQNDIPAMFPLTGIHYWYQWLEWINNFQAFITKQSKLSTYSQEVVSAIQDLVVWIEDNFMKNLTLPEAAQKTNLSPSYLSHCFKDIMGIPLNQYIRNLKLDYAKKMLLQSNLPIQRIAELCGFQDLFYFDKVFKKTLGETPGSFRQRHRK